MTFEVIESAELAKRWRVPETWIRDQVRTRATDPLPHLRFGSALNGSILILLTGLIADVIKNKCTHMYAYMVISLT